jgi:hypothetical protein
MHLFIKLLITLVLSTSTLFAYELHIVQGISNSGQTFITRTGKKDGVIRGKKATFTADNVSIIAKAITVTREFTQWEIENNFSEIPFKKGQVVTYYDTTEYLWALTPEKVKRKFIKTKLYAPRRSMAVHTAFVKGISETVSGVDEQDIQRGGLQLEGYFESEFNINFAAALGLRYATETINVNEASLATQRFVLIAEGRYYFDPLEKFYGARPSFALGFGYGQSATQADGLSSSGAVTILPITKFALSLPISKITDFTFEVAFESLKVDEEFQGGTSQVTSINNLKTGIAIKRFFK